MKKYSLLLVLLLLTSIATRVSAQGPAWSWAHAWAGNSYDEGNSIATDATGNVYVAGEFFSPIVTCAGIFDTLRNSGSRFDCFIIKYSPSGSVLWVRNFGRPLDDEIIHDIAADAAGNVYIHGNATGSMLVFDEDTLSSPGTIIGAFTAKLNTDGEVQWARQSVMPIATTGTVTATSVAVDMNGNVIASGIFTSASISFGTDMHTNAGVASDIYLVKYDANGNYIWSKRYGNVDSDIPYCMTIDASNNIWFSGYFNSTSISFGSFTFSRSITNPNPIYIAKIDPDGNAICATSGLGNAIGIGIAADPFGNVILTGTFTVDMTLGGITLSSAGGMDFFIAKFSKDGALVWLKRNGSTGFEKTVGVATDNSGKFFITGFYSTSTMTFGDSTITNSLSGNDLFVAKYDTSGTAIWAMTAKGPIGNDPPSGIATDKSGNNIYITGYTVSSNISFGPINMIAPYAVGGQDAYVAKINVPVTGINQTNHKSTPIKIYPNPASNQLTIEGHNIIEVRITDITGKEVHSQKTKSDHTTINISTLIPGIYSVRVSTAEGEGRETFVKE